MAGKILYFLTTILRHRELIVSISRREVANQYVGSVLGFIWTFINPLVLIFVFWVVFSVGFRVQPTNNVPFVVWLTAGLAIWFAFADIVGGSVGAVVANGHLVKKMVFPSEILPVVKIVSSMVTHLIFLTVLVGLILLQDMRLSLYFLQAVYYFFCMSVLALGVGWVVSALHVFLRDIGHVVALILQVGMWATPILWDIGIMPAKVQLILKLNPMFYIVQGYRESFIYFVPFWQHPLLTLYFWLVAAGFFVLGIWVFSKFKPQFADVL
ncbi:MAG: ABC transporter permease [Desulfobulbaceae bacterium]|nr:ABC transporter permease [Desulfobulbaceae bacterium]